MRDFSFDLSEVRRRVDEAAAYLKVDASRTRLAELEIEVAKPDLWNDQEHAKRVNTEYSNLKGDLDEFTELASAVDDLEVLHEMAREIDDASQEPELESGIAAVRAKLDALDLRSLFTGEHDEADAIVQINAKDGGVDAQDWSEMLLRMYQRWAERKGFAVEIGDVSEGTEAGILSADFTVRGRYAYGLLTSERGTHRLVRISPVVARRASRPYRSGRYSKRSTSRSMKATFAWKCSVHLAQAASTSTRHRLRCDSSTSRLVSSPRRSRSDRSCRIAKMRSSD